MMTQVQDALNTMAAWLASQQQANGGWGEERGRYTNVLNTAEAVIGILKAAVPNLGPGSPLIENATVYLLNHQTRSTEHAGCWSREVRNESTEPTLYVPDVARTAAVLEALLRAGRGARDTRVASAIDWLIKVRNSDNGWGFGPAQPSKIFPTYRALSALIQAARARYDQYCPIVNEGIEFLRTRQLPNGAFCRDGRLDAVHTLIAIRVLQEARHCQVPVRTDLEERGLAWVREHPDRVLSPVEEDIVIDPSHPQATYPLVYAPDTLTIEVLVDSTDTSDRELDLYTESLKSLKSRMDDAGGVFGPRTFSWSTAQALASLAELTEFGLEKFPRRRIEPDAASVPAAQAGSDLEKARLPLLVFISILVVLFIAGTLAAALIAGLALAVVVAIFMMVVMAFVLVSLGKLTGKGFVDVALGAIGGIGRHPQQTPSGAP